MTAIQWDAAAAAAARPAVASIAARARAEISPEAVGAALNFVAAEEYAPKVIVGRPGQAPQYRGRYVQTPTVIENARRTDRAFSLDREGFELRPHQSAVQDFEDQRQVDEIYAAEVEALLLRATGARQVVLFDHTVRKDGAPSGRGPARHVHVDYTDRSAPQRVREILGAAAAEPLLKGRVAQVNVWRSIAAPVERAPLALLDAQTLAETDLARTEIIHPERVGEIYGVRARPEHRWFWFPRVTRDEALLIKGYDSATDGRARFTPHSAFDDPTTRPGAPARESIETRAFVFYG